MVTVRRAAERGHAEHGWLRTWHTFSFADYFDPAHVHFRGLRVLNEDIVAPGTGFGMHPHRDMEILTWILAGALEHRDSMGNGSVIRPGEVQVMSAGTGVLHSEQNPSATDPVHLLQIWIFPARKGLPPRYEQRRVADLAPGRLHPISGPPGSGAPTTLHADAVVLAGTLGQEEEAVHELADGRGAWLQVARGAVEVDGVTLAAGDGASLERPGPIRIAGRAPSSEVLLFDLA